MAEYYTKTQSDAQGAVLGARIKTRTSDTAIRDAYERNSDVNRYTDADKAAVATIEPSHFKGEFNDLASIPTAGARAGDYAILVVDNGDDTKAIYDAGDGVWRDTGAAVTGDTPAQIKQKYESNPDTNVFTDAQRDKLDSLIEAEGIEDFTAALDAALA